MTQSSNSTAAESSHKRVEFLKRTTRFPNLRAAGRELALQLQMYCARADSIVMGIALGGVPVAHEVAIHLRLPFDLVLIRRLLAPHGPGSQICAINVGGSTVIDEELANVTQSAPLQQFVEDAIAELKRREQTCRRGHSQINLASRRIILVDCGIRSGSTMKAAIGALRTMKPERIIGAVPVASPEGYELVASLTDELVCLAQPQSFGHAGLWYEDFSRPEDDRVAEFLEPSAQE